MINPVVLSDIDVNLAQTEFKHWLDEEPVTLLVVPGMHAAAIKARDKADAMINSGSANYAGVRLIHAPEAAYIIPILKDLKNASGMVIDWNNLGQYAILAITNKYNNIAAIVLNSEFTGPTGGIINQMVLDAFALDK
jgi:hypothetical protein